MGYGILFTLVRASMSLQTYQKTWKGYLLWQGPFSIQAGWIMAASAVMTNTLCVAYDATTTAKIVVGALSLVVLLVTAFTWLSSYPVDFAIPCVIVWALYGVYAELNTPMTSITEEFTMKQITGVRNGVLASMILIGVGIIGKIVYVFAKQRPTAIAAQEEAQQHEQHTKKKRAGIVISSIRRRCCRRHGLNYSYNITAYIISTYSPSLTRLSLCDDIRKRTDGRGDDHDSNR